MVIALLVVTGPSALATRGGREPAHTVTASVASCPVAGQCGVDPATGCPTDGPITPPHGEHCVSLPADVFWVSKSISPMGCAASLLLTVEVPAGIDAYEAVVYSDVGLGTRWWTSPGQTSLSILNGLTTYYAPSGSVVYGVGGGSGGGDCTKDSTPMDWLGEAAWGITYKREVSGTDTVNGGGGPAPGIHMQASCSAGGGGTTTTDKSGYYAFLVNPGTCTIAPQLPAGLTSTPAQRVVEVPHHDVDNVNFEVPCGAVSTSTAVAEAERGPVSANARLASAAGSGCDLVVKIAPRPDEFHAGLTFESAATSKSQDGGPLFAYRGVDTRAGNVYCVSGCTQLTVTVKARAPGSSRLVPVSDATLNASVTPIGDGATNQSLKGYLCTEGATPHCGLYLSDLHTDDSGTLELVYWAPGVAQAENPVITVKADETCTKQVCPRLERHGEKSERLTVLPHLLADKTFTLTENLKRDLTIWGGATFAGPTLSAIGDYFAPSPSGVLQSLADHVLDAGEEDPLFGFTALAVQVAYNVYRDAGKVEQEFVAAFLNGFGLPEVGLGDSNMDWSFTSHDLDPLVQGKFLDDFANWSLTALKGKGSLYKLAQEAHRYGIPTFTDAQVDVHLKIIDDSYCQESTLVTGNESSWYGCGPGYFDDGTLPPSCASHVEIVSDHNAWEDIRGYVLVEFSAAIENTPKPLVNDTFVVPYNPFDWQFARSCGSQDALS